MGLVINTNVASINAQRNLSRTESSLNTSLARLSSGMRITAAKDDAAGLAISEKLRAQIRGLGQAERNAQDGISLVQTAEGALNEVSGALIRMRELAVQAATGTLGSEERGYLNDEFLALMTEIDRISDVTEFNGKYLLNGLESLSNHPSVGDVRGLGLLTAIEFVKDKATRERFPEDEGFCSRIMDLAVEEGLILRRVENIIEFCPPLIITKSEVDEMLEITERAVTQAEKEFGL